WDAEAWATNAITTFPRDADLLLARGCVREETATIGWPEPTPGVGVASPPEAYAIARREEFKHARQDLHDLLALDPHAARGHLRLGRVLWRLNEPEPAQQHLEAVLASPNPIDLVYLAHLFLGRVHQDAGRLAEATREYTLAAELHPTALSA